MSDKVAAQTPLPFDRVLATLEEVVAEKPDFVYVPPPASHPDGPKCLYVAEGKPSCGVGVVLHRLGVPLEVLAHLDYDDCGAGTAASGLDDYENGCLVDTKAAKLLGEFQGQQDDGMPWQEALEWAKMSVSAGEKMS